MRNTLYARTDYRLATSNGGEILGRANVTNERRLSPSLALVTGTILLSVGQLVWFGSKCIHQIDFDGMSYVGLARHIREGQYYDAINAFRSPLISWLIASISFLCSSYLRAGKVVSITSWLLCVVLLYVFSFRLWRSRIVAALTIFLFVLGRGLCVIAIAFVTPDFLFAAIVLVYFLLLQSCIQSQSFKNWFWLGGAHALAFLAKGFALPWLACSTIATLLLLRTPWKTRFLNLILAALLPAIATFSWASVLHSKYGTYSIGSQFKANAMQWVLKERPESTDNRYAILRDVSRNTDEYMVFDPMPPGAWQWAYQIPMRKSLPKFLLTELRNLPKAMKELTIIVTPGILLAFCCVVAIFARNRDHYREWNLAVVIASSLCTLIVAYCLLVFDERYLFPVIPLVLAVGTRFLVTDARLNHAAWRHISVALTVVGLCVSLVYSSSPFRVLTRDFQTSSYQAGKILRGHKESARLVSIGSGPFPEHGVGQEAGYLAAYFGEGRLIAAAYQLPSPSERRAIEADVVKASPDALLLWGRQNDADYLALKEDFSVSGNYSSWQSIIDPQAGEVGIILFARR
jgi:hypothetical protein